MYLDLVTTAHGQPKLPEPLPPAQSSFEAMGAGFDLGFADLGKVYDYVRRGKHLLIPEEWKHLIPKPS